MQSDNRLLDDLAKLAAGALGALQNVQGEVSGLFRQEIERLLADMDLVSREEFDALKAMAAKARAENEMLKARIESLEARHSGKTARNPSEQGASKRRGKT
jgi:BMFP domain-containing protein YqiC